MFVYGGFIFLFVYAFTELMDRNPNAWIWELAKSASGIGILYWLGDWFGMSKYTTISNYIFVVYFLLSTSVSFYFSFAETRMKMAETA